MNDVILEPRLSLSDAVVLLSIAHGLVVCGRLLVTKESRPWWLVVTVAAVCLLLLNYVARRTGLVTGQYSLQVFSAWFLIAPCYYLHIARVAGTRVLPHLVLPAMVFLITLVLPSRHIELFFYLSIPTFAVQSLYYFYRSFERIAQIEKRVKMSGSDSRLIEISDVRVLNALFLGWLLLDSGGSIWMLWRERTDPLFSLFTMLLLANWLYLLVARVHALRCFPGVGSSSDEDESDTGLSLAESGAIAGRLLNVLEDGEAYLEPDLRLGDLARKMGVPTYKVTQLLNGSLAVSFYDIVNAFRVRAAANRLVSGERVKYLAVAFETGFSSESSFYRIFRRHAGATPSKIAGGRQFPTFPEIDRLQAFVAEHGVRSADAAPVAINSARRREGGA